MSSRQRTWIGCATVLWLAVCVGSLEAQGRRGQGPGQPGGPPPGGFPGGPGMPGGPGGRGMPGFPGMGMMGGMFGGRSAEFMLLAREDVQKHLELVDDQLDQLTKVRESMDPRQMFNQLRDVPEAERAAKSRELMQSAQQKLEEQIDDILLPHQVDRLKQLAMQWQMRGPGGLASDAVAESLGIDRAEREKLRSRARELERQLRKELMEKLLKELTPQQQAKYKELVGEPFDFGDDPFGGFGRGGFGFGPGGAIGGPGGPGGRGGPGEPGARGGGNRGGDRRGRGN